MAELQLKSHRFRNEREASWRRLDSLMTKVERQSVDSLTDEQLLEIPVLYRSAMSSLSVARSISLDQGAATYLENLCLRAYLFVYGVRSTPLERLARFFREDWPRAIQSIWRETLLAAAMASEGDLLLDLGGVSDFDSSGVQLLLSARLSLQAQGRALRLVAASPAVRDALRTFGLNELLAPAQAD